ncbi:MAG: 2-oxoglutarate and iron-dependent oxygenase domain-containing protein [Deltaproteobacteria bacterium]|nr:2-oxoglutarate and iron-dependent oxygenase domain-containing protein [Deltaproteobacteria bacterium]
MSTSSNIPTVDLADFTSADSAVRDAAAQAVRHAFGHFGLVYLCNHGIDSRALDAFYDEFLAFCALPEADKRRLGRADLWYQRGWTPPNTEQAVVAQGQPDFKECYFCAPEPIRERDEMLYPQIYAKNVWPENQPAFSETMLSIGSALHRVGVELLRGCALALGLDRETLAALTEDGPHVTRSLRYLPLSEAQVGSDILWGEEHTDFNLVTLLPGGRFIDPKGATCARPDSKSGLYLRTHATEAHPQGELVSGTPPAGCIVAQVGQQLEILTGGRFLATPHVVTAPGVAGYSRASMAHFVHVHTDTKLFPLEPFCSRESMKNYGPPVLSGTYAIKTLVDIALAPRSALDHLGYRHYDRLAGIRKSAADKRG